MITLTKVYFCLIILWVCLKQIKLNFIEYQPNEVVTIVGTVDGGIHGINRNRERVWSSSTGGQMVASQNHEPTVSYDGKKEIDGHMDRQGSEGGLHHVNKDYYSVLTAIDGSIIHQTHDGMRKTSVTARFLTEQTPFISKEGLVFTGKKSSKIMGFDVNTGKVLFDNGEKIRTSSSVNTLPAIKKLPTVHTHSPVPSANSIWFGRVDYSLRAIDSSTGKEQFNLTYSELHPLLSQSAPSHHYGDAAAEDDPFLVGKQELNALALIGSPKAGMTAHPSRPVVELVSTPNGELYFSDSDGKLLDKVPISLKSPAMSAFDLIRKSARSSAADSFDSEIKNSNFDIRSINVNHRIITPLLTSIASTEKDQIILLQSPHSALGTGVDSIYALPVSTMQTDYPQSNADRSNDAKALTPILSSVYHNGNAVEEFDGDIGAIEDLDDDGNVLDTAIPLRIHVGGSKGRGLAVKSLKILSHLKELSNVLSTTPVPISQLSQHGGLSSPEDKQPVRETPLVIVDGLDCDNRLFSAYYYSDALAVCKLCRRNFNVVPCDSAVAVQSPSIRGQHRLRDEVYEGGLFNPHIQIASLFGGVLDSDGYGEASRRSTVRSYDVVTKSPFDFNADEFKAAIQLSYYQKVLQIMEHLALYGLVILASMVVVLIGIVYFIRSSAQYSHLLPSDASFLVQIFFVVQQLFERHIITAVSKERSTENPSDIADNYLKNSKSESYIESVDADGKRIVRIGSLVVHVEDVLGHGSHGTIVCRGSLNGRPLAVKRVLAQFTKEADREISLLIRSDGHPNVVRYFLKEEKRDFVYLGLQLCEMSLKDFIANIKGNLEAINQAKAKSFFTSDARVTSMISEEVKSSLFQVAQGLAHLHTQRIVHRDIKPHNILLASPNEHPSVADEQKMKLQKSCESPIGDDECSLDRLSNYILKISDMGLSKQLDRNEHSFSSLSFTLSMSTKPKSQDSGIDNSDDTQRYKAMIMLQHQAAVGTVGWQAPELIRRLPQSNMNDSRLLRSPEKSTTESPDDESDSDESIDNAPVNTSRSPTAIVMGFDRKAKDERHLLNKAKRKEERKRKKRTLKVDVFSLGCVFYYVLTTGDHPFGEWFERESNIIAGTVNLSGLQSDRIAVDLIAWMLDMDPLKRPSSKEVCKHLFFWSYAKRLEFLVEFSDRLEHEQFDAPIMLAVEAYSINANSSTSIIGTRWDRRLDPLLLEDMKKFRKYDTSSIRDLLRVIRNKRHHFNELSTELKASIGSLPNGFYNYFHHRFPSLLLHCAEIANKHLSNEKTFSTFLSSISPNWRYRKAESNIPSSARMKQDDSSPGIIVETVDEAALIMSSTTNSVTWDSNLKDVVVLQGSVLEASLGCEGWWRNSSDWIEKEAGINNTSSGVSKKQRASHLTKSATDLKYRTRLCSHWEMNMGGGCPMRKKGKCIFAHGPLELRVKESRRDKWGKDNTTTTRSVSTANDAIHTLRYSGGEDVLGAARLLTSVGDKPIMNQNDSNTFMSNYNMQQYLVNPYMMPMQSNAMYYSGHTVYYPNYTAAADASSVTYQHATNDNHTTTTINK